MTEAYTAVGAPQDDVVQHIFNQFTAKDSGRISTAEQWAGFTGALVAHGCLESINTETCEEARFLAHIWGSRRGPGVSYNEFISALMSSVESQVDPSRKLEELSQDCLRSATDLHAMIDKGAVGPTGSPSPTPATRATLAQLMDTQGAALAKATAIADSHAHAIRSLRQEALLLGPIGTAVSPAELEEAQYTRVGGHTLADPRAYQAKQAAAIASEVSCSKVVLSDLTIVDNPLCTAASLGHWFPIPMDVKGGITSGSGGTVAELGHWTVSLGSGCIAVDDKSKEFEIVRAALTAPVALMNQLWWDYMAHAELALSPYFPTPCGTFTSATPPPRYGDASHESKDEDYDASPRPRHRKSVGPLTPPLTSKGSPAPHVVFLYRAVGSNINQSNLPSLCVGHLVAAYGPLCPGQPLFKHVASRVLAALCHIDARSTHTLTTPLSLDNVFIVPSEGLSVYLGRLPCGPPIQSSSREDNARLLSRARLLGRSAAQILQSLITPETGSNPAPRVFTLKECLKGIHIRTQEHCVLECASLDGSGRWDSPQLEGTAPEGALRLDAPSPAERSAEADKLDLLLRISIAAFKTCSIALKLVWQPSAGEPVVFNVPINVHEPGPSPSLSALIQALECVHGDEEAAGRGRPLLSLHDIAKHPLFAVGAVDGVQADFNAHFSTFPLGDP